MAIAAQRFKFLDKETNLPVKDFTSLADNQIYNQLDQLVEKTLKDLKLDSSEIASLQGALSDIMNAISSGLNNLDDMLQEAVDSLLSAIGNLELPDFAKNALSMLGDLDLDGLKGFLKNAFSLGASFYCNNRNFLKNFLLGFSLNRNILSGLLLGLLLSSLDDFCLRYSKRELKSQSPLRRLETVLKPKGIAVSNDNYLNNFMNLFSDYQKFKAPLNLPVAPTLTDFRSSLFTSDPKLLLTTIREAEVDSATKDSYLQVIEEELNNYSPGSSEYNKLLSLRGNLIKLPTISTQRKEKNNEFEYLSANFGSFLNNLSKATITSATFISDTVQKSITDKLLNLKDSLASNQNLVNREHNHDSYLDFNFDSVLPQFNEDELNYINSKAKSSNSHKVHNLSPTTMAFFT